jgi:hypothetical protein
VASLGRLVSWPFDVSFSRKISQRETLSGPESSSDSGGLWGGSKQSGLTASGARPSEAESLAGLVRGRVPASRRGTPACRGDKHALDEPASASQDVQWFRCPEVQSAPSSGRGRALSSGLLARDKVACPVQASTVS